MPEKKYDPNKVCRECHAQLNDVAEYHPYTFCQLYKVGINPWQFVADTLWAKGWEAKSVQILDRFTVRDMNRRARRAA